MRHIPSVAGPALGLRKPEPVIGQPGALAALARFLDQIRSGPAALMLEGEVGTGKTALWTAASAAARARGYRVLACRPDEAEASMTYAALGDLLQAVLQEALPSLPGPQQRALRVAALMEDPEGQPPDQRSVSVATLGVLRFLSEQSPVLLAVDDVRWIDAASARVLEFALRRLETEPAGVLVVLRHGESPPIPWLADEVSPDVARHRVTPAPLDHDALDALFRARLGESFPRSMLTQIVAASGGNPLFGLEIARGLLRGEIRRDAGTRLSVPGSLQQVVGHRLANLPHDVRELLFLAAAVSQPTMELLRKAVRRPARLPAAVEFAERAGVVEVAGDRLLFTHPLFASTLYHAFPAARRRALHGLLARAVDGPDERARHLALAVVGPDAAVAAALDEASRRAAMRGAPDAAAGLSEQASRLTPGRDAAARGRRTVEAAEHHFAAGDTGRARQLLERVATSAEPGPVRASILRRLAKVRYRNDSCAVAAELLTRALHEAGEDTPLRAGIERDLAWAVALCGDVRDAAEHARSSLRLVAGMEEDEVVAEPLAAMALMDFLLGDGMRPELIGRAVELERPRPEVPIEWRPTMMLGMMLKWSGDLGGARRHFEQLHRSALDAGDEASLPYLLGQMSETATWAGDWRSARAHAIEAHTTALQSGQEPIRASALYARALVEAHLGLADEARATAHAGLRLSEDVGSVVWMMQNQAVLGFVELSLDDPVAAHGWLAPLVTWQDVVGIREPGILRFVPDAIEALVALGDVEQAHGLLLSYEADAARLERPWAMLAGARCRALHTAATGEPRAAAASLEAVLAEQVSMSQPFERARALITLGAIQRRTLQRRAARASLEAALTIFDDLGARSWSAKALHLLGRDSTARDGQPAPLLTPAEERVAASVAAGATNRETADRLFVSVRAVEVHLTSIYRKFGISSRTQLALRMAVADSPPDTPLP